MGRMEMGQTKEGKIGFAMCVERRDTENKRDEQEECAFFSFIFGRK